MATRKRVNEEEEADLLDSGSIKLVSSGDHSAKDDKETAITVEGLHPTTGQQVRSYSASIMS